MQIKHSPKHKWVQTQSKDILVGVIHRILYEEKFVKFKEVAKKEWTASHLNYIKYMKNLKY
jgi:hypothetical protein